MDKELRATIAKLESKVDILESEVHQLNEMLIQFGFTKGIESLKRSIKEILRADEDYPGDDDVSI